MKKIFILVFSVFIFVFQNAQAESVGLSEAYENEIVERVKSVFQTKEVKEIVERPICATPLFMEIRHSWDRFSAKTREVLKSYLERPTYEFEEHTYDTPQGHFKIHYVTEGENAVPNERWVDTCGQVLEHVWDTEIGVLGYDEPPSDGWHPAIIDNGGDGKYDIYLLSLDQGILGYTSWDSLISTDPTSWTTYIVLDNDYDNYPSFHTELEWLQVTSAHEFFHAIQVGYDPYEYDPERGFSYWMEMSAVWMEDMVYDDVNDYLGYLQYFFNEPWLSLKTFRDQFDYHPYASCVWPIFLSERFDTLIIKEIWENCAEVVGNNVIDPPSPGAKSATDKALGARGSNFEDAFREFTVWNYFTAHRAITNIPGRFYSEGDQFYYFGDPNRPIMVKVDAVHEEYPVNVTSIPHPPENLGSNYVVFKPNPELEGGIKIDFAGISGQYEVSAVGHSTALLEPFDTTFLINPVTQSGIGRVCDWNKYTEVIMIPAVVTRSPNDTFSYAHSAEYDSSCHGEGQLPEKDYVLQNFPNPFVIKNESNPTYFPFVLSSPSRVRIDILTLSGERIKTIVPEPDVKWGIGEYLTKSLAVPWDGKNENGEYVASGIYLYRFRTDKSTVIKKMAVIR
ncbi:MAG: hypothetical protein AMJ73_05215 [candidate division Zixibacteria bacterium SM1_73]|nr:MAG: hypothetical protein AMJ73_05215 [candidate division Zixibacteria bacterium SM1_73]